ncbi:hypothetical protein SLEP1_g9907 [Rubroshorea leprosula]|uniref:Uncharacterized protein n=1 Tax=Rubroshorea leprosula TaxID=152421 RepID=A0AAV5IHD6_9ROSI|nr:hypothetical protein SLEP1_g9907 [Rubroshorea leprosula]
MSLLGKWWDKLANGGDSLWKRVIREKYGNAGGDWINWMKEGKGFGSIWWRDVCRLNGLEIDRTGWLEDGIRCELDKGNQVQFWTDKWLGQESLADKYPRLFMLSTGKEARVCQMGTWMEDSWSWRFNWRRNLLSWELEQKQELESTLLSVSVVQGKTDTWVWSRSSEGKYSVKSGYLALDTTTPMEDSFFKLLWNSNAPCKLKLSFGNYISTGFQLD